MTAFNSEAGERASRTTNQRKRRAVVHSACVCYMPLPWSLVAPERVRPVE